MNTIHTIKKATESPLQLHEKLGSILNPLRSLFVKTSYIDFACQFTRKLLEKKYPVHFSLGTSNMHSQNDIIPYDVIEMKQMISPELIIDYIERNQNKWSSIIVLLSVNIHQGDFTHSTKERL